MNYWIRHIINLLILFNRRLDEDEIFKLPALMMLLGASSLLMFTNFFGLICGIVILLGVSSMAIFRMLINQGEIDTDYSIYEIPQEGETLTFTKKVTFNSPSQPVKVSYPTSSAVSIKIKIFISPGDEYKVQSVTRNLYDYELVLVNTKDSTDDCKITYFKNRNNFKTKSQIRNTKLNKILN